VAQAKPVARMLQAAVPSLAAIVTPQELTTHRTTQAAPHYRPQPDDIAFLQYTSGSTGDPKGVVLTHANLLANIRALGQAAQVTADDVFVSWLPLYHDMGLIGAWFGSLYHGIPLVLMSPLAFLARPMLWLQMLSRHRGTISSAPNFAYELCVRHVDSATLAQLDLSAWRLAFNGAEPVSPATLEAFAACFARCGLRPQAIAPVYGLAESSVGLTMPPPGRGPRIDLILHDPFAREGKALPASVATAADAGAETLSIPSCGHALPGHQVRIVDEAEY
jgi:acyl-CoA synthetase (AMP-forming)/AMP-acid ligase II